MAQQGSVVVGLYECVADDDDELGFDEGELIDVLEVISDEWFQGRSQKTGKEGMVPFNYVELKITEVKSEPPPQSTPAMAEPPPPIAIAIPPSSTPSSSPAPVSPKMSITASSAPMNNSSSSLDFSHLQGNGEQPSSPMTARSHRVSMLRIAPKQATNAGSSDVLSPFSFEEEAYKKLRPSDGLHAQKAMAAKILQELQQSPSPILQPLAAWWQPRPACVVHHKTPKKAAVWKEGTPLNLTKELINDILCGKETVEEQVIEAIILSHSSLMTSVNFFDLLASAYADAVAKNDMNKRTRACLFLRIWITEFRHDFSEASLFLLLDKFISQLNREVPCDLTLSAQAKTNEPFYLSRRHWEKQIKSAFAPTEGESKPFEPKDMAEHLTVWEWGLQMNFRSCEALEGTHLLSCHHFERLAEWVRDRISFAENLEESFAFFTEVLCVCMDLLNFSSAHAILCGFTLSGMDPRTYLPRDTAVNVIDPLYKLFGDPTHGIDPNFHVLLWLLDGRVTFLPSHMLVTKEVVQISGNAKPNENRGLDMKRVFEISKVHLSHVRNALILPDKYQFETEFSSPFLYLLDPSVCHELASVEVGLNPAELASVDKGSTPVKVEKQADTDPNGLVLCCGGFDLESLRDNINIDAENQMPLVDPTYNDPVFFRDFYDNSSPSIYFTEVDAQGRPFIVALKTYTSPKSLEQKGMAVVFTSLSIGEGNPVNHTIKGMDKGLLENDKKLAGVLVSLLSAVLPFAKQKLSLKQINPTNDLLDQILRLETISMCPKPHHFGIVHHSNLANKFALYDEGEETPAFAAFVNTLVGAPKDASFNTQTTIQFNEIDVRYIVTRRLSAQERVKTLDKMPVAIVFCEENSTPFSPMDFPHATMMFIFVSPDGKGGYKVAVASKDNIHSCSPKVTTSYTPGQIAAFITSKCINADRRAFRIFPQIWRKVDGERRALLNQIASFAGDQEDNVSKARKRASTALQGVVVGGLKRGPTQGASGQAASAPSGPVALSDSPKALGILRLCFLPEQSKKKGSSRKTKEYLQNLPALSSPLQLDSAGVGPSAHPGMTSITLNALCTIIEESKDYKQLFVNPHLKEVSEAFAVIDKTGASSKDTSYLKKFSSRVLAGVLRLWIIHAEGSVIPTATYKGITNLVTDDRMSSNSAPKINALLDTIPKPNYAVFERIIRMCSQLAKGSVTASGLLAESFAVLLFLPPTPNLDLLLKARAQKLILQTCIDHYSTIFTSKPPSLSSMPLLLVEKSSGLTVKSSARSPSSSRSDLKGSGGDLKPKKKPGKNFKSLTGKSLSKGVGKSFVTKNRDSLKESNPSGAYAKVFNLKDHCGKKVHLAKYVAQGTPLILFFYSRDHTSKSVLKLFKTNYELFTACGYQVFGITSGKTADDVSSMRLPFSLLSDSSNRTRAKYGVSSSKNATFVLNECGEIVHSFDSGDSVVEHILNAMYGVILQTGGFYLRSAARHPSHHFEYFYDLTGGDAAKEEEPEADKGLGVASWEVDQVVGWLEGNGLVDLVELFETNLLNGLDLLDLEMEDLEKDLKLEGDPLLPTLIAEINDLRVEDAKSTMKK